MGKSRKSAKQQPQQPEPVAAAAAVVVEDVKPLAAASSSKSKKPKLVQNQLEQILSGADYSCSNAQLVSYALENQAGTLLISSLYPFAQIALSSSSFPLLKEPNQALASKGAFALLSSTGAGGGEFDALPHQPDILRFANQILVDDSASLETKWYALHAACSAVGLGEDAARRLFAKHFPSRSSSSEAAAWWQNQPPSFSEIQAQHAQLSAAASSSSSSSSSPRLDDRVVDFDGIPLLGHASSSSSSSNLLSAMPPTCRGNLRALALALHTSSAAAGGKSPLLIRGVAGCGKTWTVRTLAKLLGQELIELQLDDQMDSKTLLGSMSCVGQKFTWVPGTLTRAIAEGKWVLIEDLDSAPQEILTSLKPLFESGELGLPNRSSFYPLRAHGNFRVFATSRKPQDSFVVHRVWKSVDLAALAKHELVQVCLGKFTGIKNQQIVQQIVDTHFDLSNGTSSTNGGDQAPSDAAQNIRDLFKWLTRVEELVPEIQPSGFVTERQKEQLVREGVEVLTGRLPALEDRVQLARALASLWGLVPEVGNKLVEFAKPEFKFENNNEQEQGVGGRVWSCGRVRLVDFPKSRLPQEIETFAATSVSLKTLEQIAGCVALNEPCLLVGETGCGKTSMVQLLAKCCGKQLVVQNMHVQSDATEFLGGFKPSPSLLKEGLLLHDRFLDLFPFDKLANAPFLLDVQRSCENQTWKRFCKALEDASKKFFKTAQQQQDGDASELLSKWTQFAGDVAVFKAKIHVNFSFVEGALIRAIRNGDWLLLDEVNLASGETLERLLPLLEDKTSSISLTERGDSAPIPRHPGFRLFACMNPSTDFGKKNLPTAFRSRFSEFYVDEVNEEADLTLVVSQFLQPDCLELVDAVVRVFLQSKALSKSLLFDGAGQSPRYSLRTLVRTLQSARMLATSQGQFGMARSLYESFCAHFTTCLDERCAQLLLAEATQLVVDTKLHQFFTAGVAASKKAGAAAAAAATTADVVQIKKGKVKIGPYYVATGTLQPLQLQPPPQPHAQQSDVIAPVSFVLTEHVKQNLVLVARAVAFRHYPILLQGPTSAGKTSLITHLAKLTGNRVLRINNHEHTDLQEYVGSYVSDATTGKLRFHYGALVEALQKGYWVILDELNLAPSDVLEALNRLLDDNRELFVMETQETIVPHPNFMLFATQNPPSYGGRKQLSRAFRNRFLEIHFGDIPYTELEQILKSRSRLPEAFTVKMVNVMRELQLRRSKSKLFAGKTGLITPRDLLRWADRQPGTYQELAEQGYRLLGERLRTEDERLEVQQVLEKCCNVKLDLDQMYFAHSPEQQQTEGGKVNVVWTRSMRRVFSLVHACVLNSEPVLLVGDTGLGKTKCIAAVAECFGNALTVLNCHQNTETADILGNLRPVRHAAPETAEAAVAEDKNKLFEWSDGPLVRTMREGSYFLLDEISLAEDAVLERLNSVLEPGRTLTLAERAGGAEVDEIEAKPEFRIFATMNPGGDFGKRELSPALRNRFTEIWIPSDVLGDAELVLESVLSAHPRAGVLAGRIATFASWFNANCGTSLQPLSIRDLIAWAEFVLATFHQQQQQQQEEAEVDDDGMFAHGCFLTVLDGLGVGAGGTQRAFKDQFLARCAAAFPEIFAHAKPSQDAVVNASDRFGIRPFFVPRTEVVPVSFEFEAETTQLNLFRVLRALQLPRRAVLLEGSPGVGKTSLVSMLAKAIGKRIVRINLSEHTDFSDLIGCDLPAPVDRKGGGGAGAQKMAFQWSDGVFLKALKRGDWVLLDELNLANQSVLEGLNSVLDHRACVFVPELNQTFDCPSDFRVFACQNPFAQGGGRKGLPKSFLNRFTKVFVEALEEHDYLAITKRVFPQVREDVLLGVVQSNQQLRQLHASQQQQDGGDFNLRDIFRFCELVGKYPAPIIFDLLYANRPFFKRRGGDTGIDLPAVLLPGGGGEEEEDPLARMDFDQIVAVNSSDIQFGANCVLPRGGGSSNSSSSSSGFFPPSLTPTLVHLARCVQEKWPVLLVGDSGFGKSALIHRLAQLMGQSVRVCQMTATTDSTELLGCFEQIDEWEVKRNLLIELEQLLLVRQQQQQQPTASSTTTAVFDLELSEFLPKLRLTILELLVSAGTRTFSPDQCFQSGTQLLVAASKSLQQQGDDLVSRWNEHGSSSGGGGGGGGGMGFHWVDGALINAMERGEWLVLDDANLCSPTVLDRLNGLLENDGELMVNEQGTTKDGMRVVRPAPGFRVFLTLDPKYGNVSRAMRNRCVEIGLAAGCFQPGSLDRVLFLEHFPPQLQQELVGDASIKPQLFPAAASALLVQTQLRLAASTVEEKAEGEEGLFPPFGRFPTALSSRGVDFRHDAFVSNLRVLRRVVLRMQQAEQKRDAANDDDDEAAVVAMLSRAVRGEAEDDSAALAVADEVLFGSSNNQVTSYSNAFSILLPLVKRLAGSEELEWFVQQQLGNTTSSSSSASWRVVSSMAALFLGPAEAASVAGWGSPWKQPLEALCGVRSKQKLLSEVLAAFDAWTAAAADCGSELVTLRDDLFRVCDTEEDAVLVVCWRRFCKRVADTLAASSRSPAQQEAWLHLENAMARFDAQLQARTGLGWAGSKTRWPLWKRGGHPTAPTNAKSLAALHQLLSTASSSSVETTTTKQKHSQAWRRDALAALCVLRYSGAGGGGGAMITTTAGAADMDALRAASLATVLHPAAADAAAAAGVDAESAMAVEEEENGGDDDAVAVVDRAAVHVNKVVKRVLYLLESKVIQSAVVAAAAEQHEATAGAGEFRSCEKLIELAVQTDTVEVEKLAPFQEYIWNPKSSSLLVHEMLANSLLEPELTQASITNEIAAFLHLPSETVNKADTVAQCDLLIHALHHFPKSTTSDLDGSWRMIDALLDATTRASTAAAADGNDDAAVASLALRTLQDLVASRQHIGKAFALLGFVRFQLYVPPQVDPEKKKQVKLALFEAQLNVLSNELLALEATRRVQGHCPRSEIELMERRIAAVRHKLAVLAATGAVAVPRQAEFASYAQRVQSFTRNFASEERFCNVLQQQQQQQQSDLFMLESFYDTLKEFAQAVWRDDRRLLTDLVEPFVGAVALALHGLRIVINERKTRSTTKERELVHSLIAWPRSEPTQYQADLSGLVGGGPAEANKRAKLNTLLVLLAACEGEAKQDLSQRFIQLTAQWRADRKLQEERRQAKEAAFRVKEAKTPEQEHEEAEAEELQAMFPDFHTEFDLAPPMTAADGGDQAMMDDDRDGDDKQDEEDDKAFAALSADQVETLVESFIKLYSDKASTTTTTSGEDGQRDVIFRQCYAAASLLEPNVMIGDNLSDQAVLASNLYALTEFRNSIL